MDGSLSVAVLAGGASRRMGTDKGLIEIAGRPMALWVLDAVLAGLEDPPEEVMFVANAGGYEDLAESVTLAPARVLADLRPGLGPLAGIETALAAASSNYVFVAACDLPLVDPGLVRELARHASGAAVIPVTDSGSEPCFAIYSRSCLEVVGGLLDEESLEARAVLGAIESAAIGGVHEIRVENLDPGVGLSNVNTPEELGVALRALGPDDIADRENSRN